MNLRALEKSNKYYIATIDDYNVGDIVYVQHWTKDIIIKGTIIKIIDGRITMTLLSTEFTSIDPVFVLGHEFTFDSQFIRNYYES
ncbi:MAG: hypothetical protein GY861_11040 [bacterium]|nr:hypothetical protein [bacterium]